MRAQLELLEGLLPRGRAASFPLRAVLQSIARRLRCHTEKEEALLKAVHRVRHGPPAEHAEHAEQRATLHMLRHLLAPGRAYAAEEIAVYGAHLIDGLREHMADEEERFFPAADRLLNDAWSEEVSRRMHDIAHHHYPEGEPLVPVLPATRPIMPEMTVNHVLRVHPGARAIFERFQVDWQLDGHHCLDELYWRRGVDGEALLAALNQSDAAPHAVSAR